MHCVGGGFQLPDKEFDCPLSWLWKSILRRVASGKGTYILLTCIADFMHLSLKLVFVDELARKAITMYYSRRHKLLQYACEWEIQPTNLILKHNWKSNWLYGYEYQYKVIDRYILHGSNKICVIGWFKIEPTNLLRTASSNSCGLLVAPKNIT